LARVAALALFHGYGVLAIASAAQIEETDVQEVGSGGRIDKRLALAVAVLRSIPYR